MARIGFVGLGNMGGPMARNLVKAGHQVAVFDLSAAAMEPILAAGAARAASADEAARGRDFVVTMLPAGKHVREVVLGPGGNQGGMAAASDPGTVFIDCSTIDVATAKELADRAGRPMLDAPVSGGTMGAENATLTFMVGGEAEAFALAEPILKDMGRTIVHCGAAGAGQSVKACNNMMLAASMLVTAEAFAMVEKLGIDPQALFDVVSKSTGQSWALTSYCPWPGLVPTSPANRDYAPGFTAALMLKDLGLAQEAARDAGVAAPVGAKALELYRRYVEEKGEGAKDFSGIIRMVRGKV
jgi:3-hydroxyisobutyrate dehydrogenase